LAYVISDAWFYSSFSFPPERPCVLGFIIFTKAIALINSFLQLIYNTVSRHFEYVADGFARALGYQSQLAEALVKLEKNNLGLLHVDWLYGAFYRSHPSLPERLEGLGWRAEKQT
jgi:STE24 endopeptidase